MFRTCLHAMHAYVENIRKNRVHLVAKVGSLTNEMWLSEAHEPFAEKINEVSSETDPP